VIVALVTVTGCVATIDVVTRFKSLPLVPTLPSMQQVPVESTTRNHVAVPVAFALESVNAGVLSNVSTWPDSVAHGSESVISESSVVAVPHVPGREPS
jgi:hypothetical protein